VSLAAKHSAGGLRPHHGSRGEARRDEASHSAWIDETFMLIPWRKWQMRTTLALDDELLKKAQAYTGLREKSAIVREALRALIERESARRLARLGGSEPDLTAVPRRRSRSE
jgi:Arc/MetJ family transcription regulator